MDSSSSERDPIEVLAEEFLARRRRGERPTVEDYARDIPRWPRRSARSSPRWPWSTTSGPGRNGGRPPLCAAWGGRCRLATTASSAKSAGAAWASSTRPSRNRWAAGLRSRCSAASALRTSEALRRFEREAKAAAKLHHTNIVPVFGVGQQDGHHYYVMQFIAGLGLDAVSVAERPAAGRRAGKSAWRGPRRPVSRIAGPTGADVARSLLTGPIDAEGPPGDGSVITAPR